MPDQRTTQNRALLLAHVAEMYYLDQRDQAEIARAVGVTRSMVSRMLKEAREKGIVEVRVHRPLPSDHELEVALIERFGLREAYVVSQHKADGEHLLSNLGIAGALILERCLAKSQVLGISWGTSISATVDAFELDAPMPIKVVQLVGAIGARNSEYDGNTLVTRLAKKLGGEAYFLNAPFLCPNAETAAALRKTRSVRETINLGKQANVALVGVGSASPKYSSYYLAGYVPIEEIDTLIKGGAVGDVCGLHFDLEGRDVCLDFCERSVTIRKADLVAIPVRLAVAGGPGKVQPILGALRGGFINILATDDLTARKVLDLHEKK